MKLKILTWNLSYAYGLGSDGIHQEGGPSYEQRPASYFESALKAMSNLIQELEIDLAFFQEVDFDSKRSHHTNQLDYLSRTTDLSYRLPIVSWDMPYVPYPGFNPKTHFGKVVSGGGVISRFPLHPIQNDLLPKPRENSSLYNYFYLNRYLQIFNVELPNQLPLHCMNLHLEAFNPNNRELHLVRLQDRLLDYDIDIAAGDFNGPAIFTRERAEKWDINFSPEPSFPSQGTSLDAIVTKKSHVKILETKTLDTGTLSDHLPVLMEISYQHPFSGAMHH